MKKRRTCFRRNVCMFSKKDVRVFLSSPDGSGSASFADACCMEAFSCFFCSYCSFSTCFSARIPKEPDRRKSLFSPVNGTTSDIHFLYIPYTFRPLPVAPFARLAGFRYLCTKIIKYVYSNRNHVWRDRRRIPAPWRSPSAKNRETYLLYYSPAPVPARHLGRGERSDRK